MPNIIVDHFGVVEEQFVNTISAAATIILTPSNALLPASNALGYGTDAQEICTRLRTTLQQLQADPASYYPKIRTLFDNGRGNYLGWLKDSGYLDAPQETGRGLIEMFGGKTFLWQNVSALYLGDSEGSPENGSRLIDVLAGIDAEILY